ncbi:MAG: tRNA pseudouridine55 synthase [Parcubacteria group bacterium Athens0714_16]|nr:MAG: tRNA pseudouridine55 synthase [Parcubacteria group bacterium Athens0714_16]
MQKILNLYKEIGETPLERLDRFRIEKPEYIKEKMSYVGRLDPMAEGVLLVVVGEENKKREEYLNMDKEYEFEALLGVKSDTYDILGLAEFVDDKEIDESDIKMELSKFIGKRKQKYPAFSSKTINGIPLFEITKSQLGSEASKLENIEERPERDIEIYSIEILEFKKTKLKNFQKEILNKINLVKGDFRQVETIKIWKTIFDLHSEKEFSTFKAKIKCSSGTYIRGIVDEIGNNLESGAITLNIKRIKVGDYNINNSQK